MLKKSYTAFVGELRRCEVRCANKEAVINCPCRIYVMWQRK